MIQKLVRAALALGSSSGLLLAADAFTGTHRAGVPTGVHILRHTFGAHLTTRGAVQRARQDLLGHRSPAMTERYSHLSPGSLADAITVLEQKIRSAMETSWRLPQRRNLT